MSKPGAIPPRSTWWFNFVRDRVAVGTIRKHCHALRLANASAPLPSDGGPVLVAMNHPSWWDPLVAFALSRELRDYAHFGVIDSAMLKKYAILRKAGLIGIEMDSLRGAATFLRAGRAILAEPRHALWVTAQGEFVDARSRPLNLRPGVGHLAASMESGWVVPVALEFGFWNERTPEALAMIGEAIPSAELTKAAIASNRIESALAATMDRLALDAMSRDGTRFSTLIDGRAGIGGAYDWWRRLKALATGRRFDPSHEGTSP